MSRSAAARPLRISRPCYDKYARCPGWAGPGTRRPRRPWCDIGRIQVDYTRPSWWWRIHRCSHCHVYVLPYAIRYVDPTFLRWVWTWRMAAFANRLREPTPAVPTMMTCQCGTQGFWFPGTPGICPNPTCGAHWRWPDGS